MTTPNENSLGIKNYRKEWSGLVQQLTNVPIINPKIDNLANVEVFNSRFQQLAQSIRHAFNAAGDIAIRDKRYLESFLTGYTNPLVSESYSYSEPQLYTNIPTFDLNGLAINFPEPRVMYNVSMLGSLSTTGVITWVFKNGLLLEPEHYTFMNTAYGVKCFVKATAISANDRVDIVVNRVFNPTPTNSIVRHTINRAVTSTTIIIPVENLGTFYHTDYIKLYLKIGNNYTLIGKKYFLTELDTTGRQVKITIKGFTMPLNSIVYVCNTIYYYTNTLTGTGGTGWDRDIVLSENHSGDLRPVPFMTAYDFDIFYNGWKLEAGKHYSVLDGENLSGFPILRFHFTPPNGQNYTISIFKNEATLNRDSLIFEAEELGEKGVAIRYDNMETIPFMARLGNCFVASKYVPNSWISVLQRNVLQINPTKLKAIKDLFYQTRIVYTLDIKDVVEVSRRHLSEFDQVMNLFDESKILEQFADNDDTNVINKTIETDDSYYNKPFNRLYNNDTFVDLTKSSGDGDNLTNYISNRDTTSRFVLDANKKLIEHEEIANEFAKNVIINVNESAVEREIINTNRTINTFSAIGRNV